MRIRAGFSLQLFVTLLGLMAATALGVEPPSPPAYNIRMESTWIPMRDGIRLAVTLYMPDGAKAGEKFPAVLEYHLLLRISGMRHPMVEEWPGVTPGRRVLAAFALLMMVVTLTPAPFAHSSLLQVVRAIRGQ